MRTMCYTTKWWGAGLEARLKLFKDSAVRQCFTVSALSDRIDKKRGENSWILQRWGGPWTHRETLRMQNTWWAACRCSMYRYSPLFHIQPENILRTYYSLITKVFCLFCRNWESLKLWGHSVIFLLLNQRRIFFYFSPVMSHSGFGLVHFETVVFSIKANRKYPLVTQERKHTHETPSPVGSHPLTAHTPWHTLRIKEFLSNHTHMLWGL